MIRTRSALLGLTLTMTFLLGCPSDKPLEMTARDSIATAKGFLTDLIERYKDRCIDAGDTPVCTAIMKGVAAQNMTIDALHVYCASDTYENGGPCTPNKDAAPKLKEALMHLESIRKEVEAMTK